MRRAMTIDFVSDICCPWCAIALRSLELAIERIGDAIDIDLRFQPFELNPDMPPEGQNIVAHVGEKYGSTPEQSAQARANIRAQGASLGLDMTMSARSRMYNSFDAHRLLHWSGPQGRQHALKRALFEAYFAREESPADHDVLADVAGRAGLDPAEARAVLESGAGAQAVRSAEQLWIARGIDAVPAIVIDERHLISGAHAPEAFEQALRKIAAAGD